MLRFRENLDKSALRIYPFSMDIIRHTLDISEDRRRLDVFNKTRVAVPWDEVKAWMQSWGSTNELPCPAPRKIR